MPPLDSAIRYDGEDKVPCIHYTIRDNTQIGPRLSENPNKFKFWGCRERHPILGRCERTLTRTVINKSPDSYGIWHTGPQRELGGNFDGYDRTDSVLRFWGKRSKEKMQLSSSHRSIYNSFLTPGMSRGQDPLFRPEATPEVQERAITSQHRQFRICMC